MQFCLCLGLTISYTRELLLLPTRLESGWGRLIKQYDKAQVGLWEV